MPYWQAVGRLVSKVLDEALNRSPGFVAMVEKLGAEMSPSEAQAAGEVLQDGGTVAAGLLEEILRVPGVATSKGPTGWRWELMDQLSKLARDPDCDVPHWFKGRTPLGIKRPIPNRGVFPAGEPTKAQRESEKHLEERGDDFSVTKNYTSFDEFREESAQELARLVEEGHLEPIGTWEAVKARWPDAMATRIATLVKAREDGTKKIRFVVDMRRSGINALAQTEERIVLPRGADLVRDALDLVQIHGGEVELFTADFQDAFLNLAITEEERGHAIVLMKQGHFGSYRGVPFGLATAPLLWGRAAAFIGRCTQAVHSRDQHRLQIYVDDPAIVVGGHRARRTWLLSRTLILWAMLGAKVALHKVGRGQAVKWIGALYEIRPGGLEVSIDAERIGKLKQVVQQGLSTKGLITGARSLAGELSWVAGIIPTIRPFVNMIWAAVYELGRQSAGDSRPGRHLRPDGSVLAKMVQLPLLWLQKFLEGHHGGLSRLRLVTDRTAPPQWFIRTDASTSGGGGILFDQGGRPTRWWAGTLTEELLQPLKISPGEPGRMTAYELVALLMSFHVWKHLLRRCRVSVHAQMDSESALRVLVKLASPDPTVNRLAAELALVIEQAGLDAVEGQHWRNVINIEADALSRLSEGSTVPPRLRNLPRDDALGAFTLFQITGFSPAL